jgi:hypothetical protein
MKSFFLFLILSISYSAQAVEVTTGNEADTVTVYVSDDVPANCVTKIRALKENLKQKIIIAYNECKYDSTGGYGYIKYLKY